MVYVRKNKSVKKGSKVSKNKRWFFDATIGKNVPIIGGTGLRMGSGLAKRSLMVQPTMNKQKIISGGSTATMKHNTLYTLNPLGNITIGSGDNARLTNSIFVKNVVLKMNVNDNGAGSLVNSKIYRALWVLLDQEYLSGSDALGAGVGSTDLFVQGASYTPLSAIDHNRCKILYDETFTMNPTISTGQMCQFHNFTLPYGKIFKYSTPTSNYSNQGNLYFVIVGYETGATAGVTNVLAVDFECTVNFTDA